MRWRNRAWLTLGAVAVLSHLPCACTPQSPLEIVEFEVTPTGAIAQCQTVSAWFSANMKARYSLTSGHQVIEAGLTQGLREQVTFTGDDLSPEASVLKLTLAAVAGAEVSESVELSLNEENTAPVARPRLMGVAEPGGTVILDGSLSEDLDGDPIASYSWRITSGQVDPRIDTPDEPVATLQLPQHPARVAIELTVTDISGASDTSELIVRSSGPEGNSPPAMVTPSVFEALQVEPGASVDLEVQADDQDGDAVQIAWRQVAGPQLTLNISEEGSAVQFEAPDFSTLIGLEVSASDGLDEARARVEVSVGGAVPDEPPTPEVTIVDGPRLFVPVRISGETTTDLDSEDLWYQWSLVRAPSGTLLGDDSIARRTGIGASTIEVVFDHPGVYELELRVADGLGESPNVASVDIDVGLSAERVIWDAVTEVTCFEDVVAWAGPGGVGARDQQGLRTLSSAEARAVAFTPTGNEIWLDATAVNDGVPAVGKRSLNGLGDLEIMPLPSGPDQINALVVDPSPVRRGDVYVGTDAGSAILDISDIACADYVGLGCWVGATSIGYIYQPPSRLGFSSTEVDVMHVSLDDEGTTVVHLGNRYWLVSLERSEGEELVSQRAIDVFSDGQPQAITALASSDDALFCGTEPHGLVRIGTDRECGFGDQVQQRCRRTMLDSCTLAATVEAPDRIADLAVWGSGLFIVASDGLYYYDSALSRFSPVIVSDGDFSGTPNAVAVCGETLFVGTSDGLWEIELGSEP